jgi:hypothetical protein
MGSRDERRYWSSDGQPHLRRYLVQAAKVVGCISCWAGMWALLLMVGPPAMSVPSGPSHASGILPALVGVLLSAGAAMVLTIIIGVFMLASIGWERNQNQTQNSSEQDGTDARDGMEDESHA